MMNVSMEVPCGGQDGFKISKKTSGVTGAPCISQPSVNITWCIITWFTSHMCLLWLWTVNQKRRISR